MDKVRWEVSEVFASEEGEARRRSLRQALEAWQALRMEEVEPDDLRHLLPAEQGGRGEDRGK